MLRKLQRFREVITPSEEEIKKYESTKKAFDDWGANEKEYCQSNSRSKHVLKPDGV